MTLLRVEVPAPLTARLRIDLAREDLINVRAARHQRRDLLAEASRLSWPERVPLVVAKVDLLNHRDPTTRGSENSRRERAIGVVDRGLERRRPRVGAGEVTCDPQGPVDARLAPTVAPSDRQVQKDRTARRERRSGTRARHGADVLALSARR